VYSKKGKDAYRGKCKDWAELAAILAFIITICEVT
jgi:hypothetical protein